MTRANSSKAWPTMIRGPAQKPRRAASPTVRVNSGPGIKAPERATMKDVTGTPANNHQSIY